MKIFNTNKYYWIPIIIILPIIIWLSTPINLFEENWSDILYDKDDYLLAAHIAEDGQWRLPFDEKDIISDKYKTCLLEFEDKRFEKHHGVDWIAITRALIQNINKGSVVSGGSTISMQVIRLSRKSKKRTIKEKLIEIVLASKLEFKFSKDEILRIYASYAPYGGNTVGIKAAAWRYFGRSPDNMTWAESALLAVLPNAPASIHINKNRILLKTKRDRLLKKLLDKDIITANTYDLAIEEEIPEILGSFPTESIHLLHRLSSKYPDKHIFRTNIDKDLQDNTLSILNRHFAELVKNDIRNMAAIIVETRTGKVVSYVGNIGMFDKNGESAFVDMISASRSAGSILKPFLYAFMLSKGEITPNTLIPDYPMHFGSYAPDNFNLTHDGAVEASRCIARSLNVPAVYMLKEHGIPIFIEDLKYMGFNTINRSADNYGLSLILGSAETRLDELAAAYSSMGRRLNTFYKSNGKYNSTDIHPLLFLKEENIIPSAFFDNEARLDAGGIWHCIEAMKNVKRPDGKGNWQYFNSEQAIAWKTGTSYGFRDAWAVGLTPDYTVAVWTGNADGEGKPGLIGIKTSAPILFDIFDMLPPWEKWFYKPYDAMIKMPICQQSGHLASDYCTTTDSIWIPKAAYHSPQCPYHVLLHLDSSETYRVNASCYDIDKIKHKSAYILPPAMEYYFRKKQVTYRGMPTWHPDCKPKHTSESMQLIYPEYKAKIYLPLDLDGTKQKLILEAAHRNDNATIYWYIDNNFIGATKYYHQIGCKPEPGIHTLSLIDNNGNSKKILFTILDEKE